MKNWPVMVLIKVTSHLDLEEKADGEVYLYIYFKNSQVHHHVAKSVMCHSESFTSSNKPKMHTNPIKKGFLQPVKSKQQPTIQQEVCLPTINLHTRDSHLNRLWIPTRQHVNRNINVLSFDIHGFSEMTDNSPRRVPTRWLTQPQRADRPEHITSQSVFYCHL